MKYIFSEKGGMPTCSNPLFDYLSETTKQCILKLSTYLVKYLNIFGSLSLHEWQSMFRYFFCIVFPVFFRPVRLKQIPI